MARTIIAALAIGIVCIGFADAARAGDLKKELMDLNNLTGDASWKVARKRLIDDPGHAKKLIQFGLPAAQKKELSYNGALVLGLAAAEFKDMKAAEPFFRVCIHHAVNVQSV